MSSMPSEQKGSENVSRGAEFRGRRAAHNSLLVLLGNLVILIVALVTTPVTLNRIGIIEFGVWAFANTTISYITILDPGFGGMISRYGARGRVTGDQYLAARICSLGTMVWCGFGALFSPVLILLTPILVGHLGLHTALRTPVTHFIYWSYALVFLGSAGSYVSSHLNAVGDQWIATIIDVVSRLVFGTVLIILLSRGWRLSAIVVATSVQFFLAYTASFIVVTLRVGWPYASIRHIESQVWREVRNFSGWLQLGSILEMLTYETDPIVIGTLVGPRSTGLWSISQRLARQITYFAYIPQGTILPALSAAYAANESPSEIRRFYRRANQFVVLTGAFLGGVILAFGPILLQSWLGTTRYFDAGMATVLVALALMAGLPRPVTAATIFAMGRVGYGVRAQALAFVVNLILTISLVHPYGLTGVLVGTLVAKITATAYLLIRFSKLLESGFHALIGVWLWPLIGVTAFSAIVGRIGMNLWPLAHQTRLEALTEFGLLGACYAVIFLVLLRQVNYFSREDLLWVRSALPSVVGRFLGVRVINFLSHTAGS